MRFLLRANSQTFVKKVPIQPHHAGYRKRYANLRAFGTRSHDRAYDIKSTPILWGAFYVARPGGFEPSTYRFVAGHSIH